jgi:hypothetical protein
MRVKSANIAAVLAALLGIIALPRVRSIFDDVAMICL